MALGENLRWDFQRNMTLNGRDVHEHHRPARPPPCRGCILGLDPRVDTTEGRQGTYLDFQAPACISHAHRRPEAGGVREAVTRMQQYGRERSVRNPAHYGIEESGLRVRAARKNSSFIVKQA